MLDHITPLILTYNEAPNIERNLRQLTWANDIVLVDSFSTDGTLEIARRFPQVRVFKRVFDTHQQQWDFGLNETEIKTSWVLALDADYIATEQFLDELRMVNLTNVSGYRANFIYCVDGRRLRSGIYPPAMVLYRRDEARYEQDGHSQRVKVLGVVKQLSAPLLHDDRKPVTRWLNSQARYSELEAKKLRTARLSDLSLVDKLRRCYVVAAPTMVIYCLFVRGGIFDGWAGMQYALERTIAELMLSLHLVRTRAQSAPGGEAVFGNRERALELDTASTKV